MNKQNFLTRMLLLFALIVGSVNGAWGENVNILSFNFNDGSAIGWTLTGKTSYNSTALGSKALQIASGKGEGTAKTPTFTSLIGTSATLTFKIASSGSSDNTLTITGNSCKVDGKASTTVKTSAETVEISITEASTSSSITFSAAKNNGCVIDDVVVYYTKASDSPLASIALSGTYPTTFAVGDDFSHEGMTVTATYDNTETDDVTNKASFSGYDMSATGNQTVTVSYTENDVTKTTSYNITVKSAAGLVFTPTSQTVAIDGKETISFSKATDAEVTFVVEDETIATYDPATGKVSGKKEGTTTITATSAENSNYSAGEAICTIIVTDPTWIDFTTKRYENEEVVTSETGIYGTVTFAKGTNSDGNVPRWYNNGSAVRFYAGNTITIKANDGYVLTGVNFHLTSSSMSTEDFDKDVTQVDKTNEFLLDVPAQQLIYTSPGKPRIDKIKLSIAEPITVTSAGYATYVSVFDLDYTGLDVKAYKASVSGTTITFTKVTTVPAGEGVLLQGAPDTYNVPVAASAVAAWADSDNAFVRGSDAAVASENGDGTYNYVLSTNNNVVGFYKAAGNTVAGNRAYLQSTFNEARLSFSFDDEAGEATGISEMKNVKADAAIYNLNGVRVKNMTKGLYIMNGKKVIVK